MAKGEYPDLGIEDEQSRPKDSLMTEIIDAELEIKE